MHFPMPQSASTVPEFANKPLCGPRQPCTEIVKGASRASSVHCLSLHAGRTSASEPSRPSIENTWKLYRSGSPRPAKNGRLGKGMDRGPVPEISLSLRPPGAAGRRKAESRRSRACRRGAAMGRAGAIAWNRQSRAAAVRGAVPAAFGFRPVAGKRRRSSFRVARELVRAEGGRWALGAVAEVSYARVEIVQVRRPTGYTQLWMPSAVRLASQRLAQGRARNVVPAGICASVGGEPQCRPGTTRRDHGPQPSGDESVASNS